ncbi:MAG: cytochrome d ubiquinol oxidase subunit II [Calditrichaeota bacterium]|nr:cytochrome d ubiquinol oxidase subunit II [Calditrichota bacterium]MCB9367189.1 cytochrome d ubiquinol oxidase subunit II [Calditrichota bacterium]
MFDLNTIWFMLVAVLLIGYAILDGFDLGVGILHLFAKSEHDRRVHMNSIGPVWDGNEVWLITGGGALFAAFPPVYAAVFSGFYLALILLLFALIFRAVSLEFRGKVESPKWKAFWDRGFGIGSLLPPVLFGTAFGNILRGIPLDQNGNYIGTFLSLLNPFSVLLGVLTALLFTAHGAIWLGMKSDGELQERSLSKVPKLWNSALAMFVVVTAYGFVSVPERFKVFADEPLFWLVLVVLILSALAVPGQVKRRGLGVAFLCSSAFMASGFSLAAFSLFPNLVPASNDPSLSLTIYNASSTPYTLGIMLWIALLGMPLVLAYTIIIYRVFRGKVRLTPESY